MTRVYVLVEGQTEEAFINELMVQPYAARGIYLTPIIVSTSRGHKGGLTTYSKVKPQIDKLCKQDAGAFITTLFDFYALPKDFPGQASIACHGTNLARVVHIEQHFADAIGHLNFIPNIVLHEFEALLLTDIDAFAEWTDNDDVLAPLRHARMINAPEDINDSVHTAPSKRIMAAMAGYQKTVHGPLIASTIGLDAIRAACPHFHGWLSKLDALNPL
ncbi:DUF4276 family protein [Novosphingobium resinovorum]|uniref:DUF4276 family protein n=1 Tax=Novosphingobium resinovorum TaxID=158500 RepID=A0A1D8A2S2_9SPHN|nr:DUF4276 family protein [Novosphingobium resinovorum]AOR76443.1 hypothetical protein BES08_06530 [Novosphingobium resinovorum]